MLSRRAFIRRAAVGAAALGIPLARAERALADESPFPQAALLDTDPDRYWAELRRQWLLAADRINLNCGSVGCTPLPVLRAMIDHLLSAEAFREPATRGSATRRTPGCASCATRWPPSCTASATSWPWSATPPRATTSSATAST